MDIVELLKVVVLAAFQGVAEFLPISSSGHLQVLQFLLGTNPESDLFLNVVLHAGTLLAILVFYFWELWKILAKREYGLMLAVIVGTIPAGLVGVAIKKCGMEDAIFGPLWVPAAGFAVTALLLWFAMRGRSGEDGDKGAVEIEKISLRQALLIGAAQAIAITPGISRSGSTIAAGLKFGLKKADCAQFSFLLAIPAIGGAALLESLDAIKEKMVITASQALIWGIGFAVSAVVGYISLKILLRLLRRGDFRWFSLYLLAASMFTFGLWVGSQIHR